MLITEAQIIIDDEELQTENENENDMIVESPVGQLHVHDDSHGIEVQDPNNVEVTISVEVPEFDSPIPGVNSETANEILMVSDPDNNEEDQEEDKQDARESKDSKKESPKWNWKERGAAGFVSWVKERFEDVPKHSGKDSTGIERAIAYLNKLDSEISRAMKMDIEGELDSSKVETIRANIENGIKRLNAALNKINAEKNPKKKKKADYEDSDEIIKEAKTVGMSGNYVNVPLLISALARMCINGTVSAGHSMEDNIKKVGDKFKLSQREKFELAFLLNFTLFCK